MNIQHELENAWQKARSFSGKLELLEPCNLEPGFAAQTLITLLQSTYANHAISRDPGKVERDIEMGSVKPWIVTRDNQPVACATLIKQGDWTSELGRAVSIENGSGAGKIAMLSAAQNKGNSRLVAEVRLAGEFRDIPGSEATQRICINLLNLVPHGLLFAFRHGLNPLRREMFAFSAENIRLIDHSPILTAKKTLSGRSLTGPIRNLKVVQDVPFRVAIPDDAGQGLLSITRESRASGAGFTLVPIEVTDQNLGTISALLNNEFEIVGFDRNPGDSGLPIICLSTIGRGEILAPTNASKLLPKQLRRDIELIDRKFRVLTGGN